MNFAFPGLVRGVLWDVVEAASAWGSLGSSRGYFGPAWSPLGPSRRSLGPSWSVLGQSGAVLEPSGAVLELSRRCPGGQD